MTSLLLPYLLAGAGHAGGASDVGAAWVTAATALAVAVAGGLAFAARWAWRILSRTRDFLDDWAGEPARPGVPERPGVMSRLQSAESLIERVLAETMPNGGSSLRDVVHRTAGDVNAVKADLTAMRGRMELFEKQRHNREKGTP